MIYKIFITILPFFMLLSCQITDIVGNSQKDQFFNEIIDQNVTMTALCAEVYGPEHYNNTTIYGHGTEISDTNALNRAAEMTELQKQQVIKYGTLKKLLWIDSKDVDEQVNDILKNTDDKNLLYTTIKTPSGKIYEQFRAYLGDTEVSGLFLKGTTLLVARTEDAWCEQDGSTDLTQDIMETGTLVEGDWKHYGPFIESKSIKATLNVNPGVRASLYIKKNKRANWHNFDSRVRSYNTSDVSCAVNQAGEYYVSIYTSTSTPDSANKSFNLTITTSKYENEKKLGQEGEECKVDSECAEGLVCSNFNNSDKVIGSEYTPYSMCIQEWMRNEFKSDEFVKVYADTTKETNIPVDGLATVAMNAILSVKINMGWYDLSEDLTLDIIAGNTGYDTHFKISDVYSSKLNIEMDGKNKILTITDLPINCPGDDSVNGNWTLRITNSNNKYWVKLVSWKLKLSSRWD